MGDRKPLNEVPWTRRKLLKAGGLAGAALLWPRTTWARAAASSDASERSILAGNLHRYAAQRWPPSASTGPTRAPLWARAPAGSGAGPAPWSFEQCVEPSRIEGAVDWFHARRAVCELAEVPTRWCHGARIRWRNHTLDSLHGGDIDQGVAQVDALAEVEGAAAALDRREYVDENAHRMRYLRMRQAS